MPEERKLSVERIGIEPETLDDLVVTQEQRSSMHAITPIDGRYVGHVRGLPTSEFEWTKRRVWVEIEYVIALAEELEHDYKGPERKIVPRAFTEEEKTGLRSLYENFSEEDFTQIQHIDRTTHHDIVAMVRWIDYKLDRNNVEMDVEEMGLDAAIHFARTSADINTNVYNTIVRDIMTDFYVPTLCELMTQLTGMAEEWGVKDMEEVVFAAQTHGQFAEYTTVKKVFANFVDALAQAAEDLVGIDEMGEAERLRLPGKMGGAVGNDDDMIGAYPDHDWHDFNSTFVESVLGLPFAAMCDQDEFNVQNTKLYDALVRINDVIIKVCDDAWEYMSRGVFSKMSKSGESGSSVMAQKQNPWRMEGGWEYLDDANGAFQRYHRLIGYRRQGDLKRSLRKRSIGIPFAQTIIGMKRIMDELGRYSPNHDKIAAEIDENQGMMSAYLQTCLKREGIESAYDEIKAMSMGKEVAVTDYKEKIDGFVAREMIAPEVGERIKAGLDPVKRIGNATALANEALANAKAAVSMIRDVYDPAA